MTHFHITNRPTQQRSACEANEPSTGPKISGDGAIPAELHRGPSHRTRNEALAILEDIRATMHRSGFQVAGSADLGYLGIGNRVTLAYALEECHGPDCGTQASENIREATAGEALIQI